MIKVGDLVTTQHWDIGKVAIVIDTSRDWVTKVAMLGNPDYEFEQLTTDLEKIC